MQDKGGRAAAGRLERRMFYRAGLARSTSYTQLSTDPLPNEHVELLLRLSQAERERGRKVRAQRG